MIEILPIADKEEEKKLLEQEKIKSAIAKVLAMKDRDIVMGQVIIEQEERELRILKFILPGYDFSVQPDSEQIFILDSLLRSAASYGENFGADLIVTTFPDFYRFFELRGFEVGENYVATPMSTIVKYD